MKPKPRRRRLVEKGGVEIFEIRIVQWFARDGRQWTSVDVTTPEGNSDPQLVETLGALEVAKATVLDMNAEAEEP